MMRVEARVLPPPDLMYKNGQTVSRSPGKWNLTPPGRGPRVSPQFCATSSADSVVLDIHFDILSKKGTFPCPADVPKQRR